MSNEKNFNDSEKEGQKPFLKGWQSFIDGAKDGFNKFTASLEKQAKKNEEFWKENKEKVDGFFNKIKEDWDNKINSFECSCFFVQLKKLHHSLFYKLHFVQ